MKKWLLSTMMFIFFNAWAAGDDVKLEQAWEAAGEAMIVAPNKVTLLDQATIVVPKGFAFVPKQQANHLMAAMGNGKSDELQGLLIDTTDKVDGFFIVSYTKDGYVKDDEAQNLNADDILESYREGTEQANAERAKQGFPAMTVAGWAQQPVYDSASHHLTWALIARDKGVAAGPDDGVNYETRLLGRDGYFSVTWVADLSDLDAEGKVTADQLVSSVQYEDGKKYEDFSASAGDKVAEYGLATLVTGVLAKKLGLIAVVLAFLAKFAKFGLIAVFGLFPWLRRFFKRKEKADATVSSDVEADALNNKTNSKMDEARIGELSDTTKL